MDHKRLLEIEWELDELARAIVDNGVSFDDAVSQLRQFVAETHRARAILLETKRG